MPVLKLSDVQSSNLNNRLSSESGCQLRPNEDHKMLDTRKCEVNTAAELDAEIQAISPLTSYREVTKLTVRSMWTIPMNR